MAQMKRRGFSASQKRDLWERWKRGQSLNDIARALSKLYGQMPGTQAGARFGPQLPRRGLPGGRNYLK